jgi:hypothetical protein
MNVTARIGAAVKGLALAIGLGIAVLVIALAGVGFLTAAFYLHFANLLGPIRAAAVTGGTLAVAALLVALIGAAVLKRSKKPQPGWLSDFSGAMGLGLRLATALVRRDPKKAMVIAAVTGVLAELIFSDGKKEKREK